MNKVSVIIPAYNAEKTIIRCLKSVCEQKLSNIEILVVDDGSEDSTASIVKNLAEKDSRIRYIYKDNGGVSSARNKGLECAKGKYISFVDSDDYVLPDIYISMIDFMKHGADLVISGFKINDRVESVDIVPNQEIMREPDWRKTFGIAFSQYLWNTPWNKMFKKSKIGTVFDREKHLGEDIKFILDYVTDDVVVKYCEEILYVNDVSNEKSLSKNLSNTLKEEQENHLIIGQFVDRHQIIWDSYLSDYFISALWVTIGKCIVNHRSMEEQYKFSSFSTDLYIQMLKYKPKKKINQFAVCVLKWKIPCLNYVVLSLLGLLSEIKNSRN